jgi:hypothetical protein
MTRNAAWCPSALEGFRAEPLQREHGIQHHADAEAQLLVGEVE